MKDILYENEEILIDIDWCRYTELMLKYVFDSDQRTHKTKSQNNGNFNLTTTLTSLIDKFILSRYDINNYTLIKFVEALKGKLTSIVPDKNT